MEDKDENTAVTEVPKNGNGAFINALRCFGEAINRFLWKEKKEERKHVVKIVDWKEFMDRTWDIIDGTLEFKNHTEVAKTFLKPHQHIHYIEYFLDKEQIEINYWEAVEQQELQFVDGGIV